MLTINWDAFLPDLALMLSAFAAGSVFGGWMARRDYARDLARLRSLVPEPGLLRRAAGALHYAATGRGINGNIASLLFRHLEELADRIEAAEGGEGE